MKNGADFTKEQLDKLDNSQLVTMTRQEARDAIDWIETDELSSAFDCAQGEVAHNGGVTFIVLRIEG